MFYISFVSSFVEVLAKLHVVENDGYVVEDEGETGAGAVGGAVASRHQAYRKTTQAKPTATVKGSATDTATSPFWSRLRHQAAATE